MKKSMRFVLFVSFCLSNILWYSCNKEEKQEFGNIYGVVTVKSTAEPMRATGVELDMRSYGNNGSWVLLNKTVTYDDGHFEFDNLPVVFKTLSNGSTYNGSNKIYYEYRIIVDAVGYKPVSKEVGVLPGRTSRVDIMLEKY